MLKCQFHIHAAGDPVENISYTYKDIVNEAKRLSYDVLCITCHQRLFFTKKMERYARKKGLLLIPGIEFEINKKHILCINAHPDIEKVDSFEKLKKYKKNHPESLIVAPHPFFPGNNTLKKALIENILLFDAIEYSYAYTKTKNYNDEAVALAKRWKKPIIATSDCHILKYFDLAYTLVDSKKNTSSILQAIKNKRIKITHSPTNYFTIFKIIFLIYYQNLFKKRK